VLGSAIEVGDWTATQAETRYGCFLPDLTGLARDLSAASLPRDYNRSPPAARKTRAAVEVDRPNGGALPHPRARQARAFRLRMPL